MYRSGDVARHLPDGRMEFLGRSDQQLKIRGYRIEPGEVEATLVRHPSVREAVVRALEDAAGERRLVAYFVARPGAAVTPQELRAHAAERLPEYMTPAAFVALDALPLTPNGKVDVRALPAPDYAAQGVVGAHALPRTPAEELLAAVWQEVLQVGRVGPEDDFFRLGGHSLLATRVVTRVREVFGVELVLQDLFEAPTLAALAALVETRQREGGAAAQPDIRPAPRDGRLPLSFAQQRLWLIDQLEPGSPVYNVPVAVRLAGRLDVAALTQTLNEIVRRHEVLRTTFVAEGGVPAQVIAPKMTCALTLHDLSAHAAEQREAEAERLISEEARRPFDLAAGPLFRAVLLRLSGEEHVLLLTMHHVVSDGWSMGVLIREMAALYEAFSEGRAPMLPELPVQYADFAVWQREWLQGPTLGALLAYWKRQLGDAPRTLKLPSDRPRESAFSAHGARQTFQLDAGLGDALKALCRQERVTLFMLLLAAFAALLQKRSGADDVVVGTDVAGRNSSATERLIGFFINQLVLRVNLAGDPSFRELLKRVRETTLGAYAHQDVPFEKLVEELQPERAVGSTPLFQVKLVLQNFPMPTLEIPGLTLAPVESAAGVEAAKFDLLMTLVETGDGLGGSLEYRTALFEPETIERLLQGFEALLRDAAARPDAHLSELEGRGEAERAAQAKAQQKVAASALQKLLGTKPKAVTVSAQDLVRTGALDGGGALPLVVRPNQLRVDLAHWVETNRDLVAARLLERGGVLFRGFDVSGQTEFERFLHALGLPLMRYTEGATPRTELGDKVYTSTEYPADQPIALHNELTYVTTWPMKIVFCCVEPATERGETPIADVRRVWQRLDPGLRRRFDEKGGWLLVRNFGEGLSLPWQRSFHTDDPREVEAYCRNARIEVEWGAGDRLRTRQARPAVARHPQTGEAVWFNHVAFWHESSLAPAVRSAMRDMFGAEGLPYNTYYGDGSPIEDEVVAEIRAAYDAETVVFPWERGDVLLLDNMMVAHGRSPYAGPRRVLAAMGEAHTRTDF
jgi:alpha-ketoglutarate-dependent taurine dioxygenase/acyl carrier protein